MQKQIRFNLISDDEMFYYLFLLETKFHKIDFDKYMLSYSGGNDSHFLYWFIKEYLKDDRIEIVGVNTYMEHREIRKRMYDNCDKVLLPKMKPKEIKEKYGIPCFSKINDEFIYRYQNGTRTENTMKYINGEDAITDKYGNTQKSKFSITTLAKELVLSGKLHKVSNECCNELKKNPMKKYGKLVKKKAITGVRTSESALRKAKYGNIDEENEDACFDSKGQFNPIWDLDDYMLIKIQEYYNIEIPNVYNYVVQTGCSGCPYGCNSRRCNTVDELKLETPSKRKFLFNLWKESYLILGISTNEEDYR
jgi:3'-phosphoadenosine 5'-phosphosulfate sulfotransferase (PAPS reductase)/FAD synthetase